MSDQNNSPSVKHKKNTLTHSNTKAPECLLLSRLYYCFFLDFSFLNREFGGSTLCSLCFLLTQVGFHSQSWCIQHLTFSAYIAGILFTASSHRPPEQFPHTFTTYWSTWKTNRNLKRCPPQQSAALHTLCKFTGSIQTTTAALCCLSA